MEFRMRLERLRDRMLLSSAELLEQVGADLGHYGSYYVENRLQKEAELAAIDARDAVLLQQSAERRRAKVGTAPTAVAATSKLDAAERSNVVDMRRNPPPDKASAAGELMIFGDDEDEDLEKRKDGELDTPLESGDVMLF